MATYHWRPSNLPIPRSVPKPRSCFHPYSSISNHIPTTNSINAGGVQSLPSIGRTIRRSHDTVAIRWSPQVRRSTEVNCYSAVRTSPDDVAAAERRGAAVQIAIAASATVVLGTANRVLHKLALVPLKEYPFFLAQFATFGYVVVYFSILYIRQKAGLVTDEMLSLPQTPFLAVGLLEALAAASGMAAAAVLSGASIPILSQTFLVWQLLLSAIFLRRRYRFNQILGCFLVTAGVVITVASGSGANASLKGAGIFWPLLMISSFLFQAADTVLKEIIFLDARKRLKGGSVDLFVINSFGSAYQALFMCLLLPFLSKLWGVPFHLLPAYIKNGAGCFLNIGSLSAGCDGAPVLPLLFVLVNMAYNISLLHLLKISSAVVSCLASTFSVPLSIYAFTLPLPYIAVASSLPRGFIAGAAVLVAGLVLYCLTPQTPSNQ
ncbi:CRT (chloroquine-resistance transporter)-like transporter 1 isoform X1 [Carex rostrata]